MEMMTRKNKKIIVIAAAILAVPVLLLSGLGNVSTYLSNALVSNNQSPSSSLSTNIPPSLSNWTGSIQVSNALSQIIQSKVHTTLSDAATSAEKLVGINSHATSANLREERGYLVYEVLVKDGYNNSHKVIVDPGNGKVLFTKQKLNNDHSEHNNDNVVYKFHHHHEDNE